MKLPARLPDTRDLTGVRVLPETDAAQFKLPHKASASAAVPTAADNTGGEFRIAF